MNNWHDHFFIRLDDTIGYYVAWRGTKTNAFPDKYFRTYDSCKAWIYDVQVWRERVDQEFEKEVLGGSEHSKVNETAED